MSVQTMWMSSVQDGEFPPQPCIFCDSVFHEFSVPENSIAGTLDLADITPATTPITSYNYATQAYVATSIAGQTSYTHTQETPSTSWSVTHNLGFRPSVFVVDTSDNVCYGDVTYTSADALTITFAQSFGGKAYLS